MDRISIGMHESLSCHIYTEPSDLTDIDFDFGDSCITPAKM